MLRFLARFAAVICAFAFVFIAVAGIFFYVAGTRLLQAQIYKDALAKEQFYERFPGIVADTVVHLAQAGRTAPADSRAQVAADLFAQLTPADWDRLIGAIAPASYLRQEIEGGIEQVVAFIHSDAANLSVTISLVELKRHLVGPEAEAAYLALLEAKPPCGARELEDAGGLPVACRPTPEQMPQVRENFRIAMRALVDRMPDQYDPFLRPSANAAVRNEMAALIRARERWRRIEAWAAWSPVVPAFLLLLIALFAVRSVRGWLLWWGIPCFFAGAFAAMTAFPVVPVTRLMFSILVEPNLPPQVSAVMLQTVFKLMTAVMQEVFSGVLIVAGSLAGGGLLAMIAARLLRQPVAGGATRV